MKTTLYTHEVVWCRIDSDFDMIRTLKVIQKANLKKKYCTYEGMAGNWSPNAGEYIQLIAN